MTCRHQAGDPNCSSHPDYVAPYTPPPAPPPTPDKRLYSIVDATRVGKHLVMKVLYPNCRSCSYEGNKVMVFLNVGELDALKWKEIDPHFRPTKQHSYTPGAPSPAARFPATPEGWKDALEYAGRKQL